MESMSAPAASTTAPKIAAYEKILRGYFGVPQNLVYLLEETTPSFVYETLDQDFDMIFFNISPLHPLLLEKLRRRSDRMISLFNDLIFPECSALPEHLIHERRFAVVDVRDDRHVA